MQENPICLPFQEFFQETIQKTSSYMASDMSVLWPADLLLKIYYVI